MTYTQKEDPTTLLNNDEQYRAALLYMSDDRKREFEGGSFCGFALKDMTHDELKAVMGQVMLEMRRLHDTAADLFGKRWLFI